LHGRGDRQTPPFLYEILCRQIWAAHNRQQHRTRFNKGYFSFHDFGMTVAHRAKHRSQTATLLVADTCGKGIFLMLGNQKGKVGWILLWAIGIPVPLLVLLFLVRGCT
jgi:hypothetical protein